MKTRALIPVKGKPPKGVQEIMQSFGGWASSGPVECVYDKQGAKIKGDALQGFKPILYDSFVDRNCVVELKNGARLFLKKTMFSGDIEVYEKLRHRKVRICPEIYGYYRMGIATLIVREFIEGESIFSAKLGSFPKGKLENLFRLLGKKLRALHAAKITLPWDVEIIVSPSGEPFFLDFDRVRRKLKKGDKIQDIEKILSILEKSGIKEKPNYWKVFQEGYGSVLAREVAMP